jgi:hypothetical protein
LKCKFTMQNQFVNEKDYFHFLFVHNYSRQIITKNEKLKERKLSTSEMNEKGCAKDFNVIRCFALFFVFLCYSLFCYFFVFLSYFVIFFVLCFFFSDFRNLNCLALTMLQNFKEFFFLFIVIT